MWQEILFEKGMRSSNLWPLGINSGFSPPSKLPRQAEMLAEFENSWERSEEELVHLSYIPEFTCRSRDCSSPCPHPPTNLSLISAPGNKNNQNSEMLFPDGVQLIKKIMWILVAQVFIHTIGHNVFHLYPLFECNKLMSLNLESWAANGSKLPFHWELSSDRRNCLVKA